MCASYQALFEPLQLNTTMLPNRIVFGSHQTNFALSNLPSRQHVDYYSERARGGAGLIVIEEGIVHPSDFPYERAILAYKKEVVNLYEKIAGALHLHGAKVFGRLNHWGSQGTGYIHKSEIWGPSAIAVAGEMPKEMEAEDIDDVIRGFALSAKHLKEAGLDGVEINAGQYSLIRQFLSPLTNLRSDQYGGSLENRARFCRQVLEAVRDTVGSDFVVGLRLTMDEYAPWAGITPEMGLELAAYLENVAELDFFSVSVGSIYSLHMTSPPMAIPEGFTLEYGRKLRQVVKLPVMVGGRINEAGMAVNALNEGCTDLVEMTRAQIASPFMANSIKRNLTGEIRPCSACNQGCKLQGFMNKQLKCTINSEAGREEAMSPRLNLKPERSGKLAVIGGGPAGMEAALQASLRGYETHIFERQSHPGGNMTLAARVPGREGLEKIKDFYLDRLMELGVKLHLTSEVTVDTDLSPYEAVIVATGSRPQSPKFPGEPALPLLNWEEAWLGADVGKRVLLVDEDGFHGAAGLIEVLAQQNKTLVVVTSEMFAGYKLTETEELALWNQRVKGKDVTFIPHHRIKEISGTTVTLTERFSGAIKHVEGLDSVVFCYTRLPREELFLELKKKVSRLYRIGDCVAPRTIAAAIYDGYKAGKSI